jgi:hypothetical protein
VSFDIEFHPADEASVHGGQLGVRDLMKEFRLQTRVSREPTLAPRKKTGKGYDPMVYIEQILLALTGGGASLADAKRLNDDEALKALPGTKRLPDPTSLGEWLRNVGTEGWQALRRINRDLARWILERAQPGRYEHAGRFECFFGDTQIEVSGPSFEGARSN